MTQPGWWPAVVAATRLRRMAAGTLLDHATPTIHDGQLRLTFHRADLAEAWRESGAQDALDAPLLHLDRDMAIEVID